VFGVATGMVLLPQQPVAGLVALSRPEEVAERLLGLGA
jgi:hypothetical protein